MTALVQEGSTINKNSWKNGSIVTISTTSMYVVSGNMVAYLGPYWSGNWHQPATMYNELKHGKKCLFGCLLERIIFFLKKMILVFDIIVQPPEHTFQIKVHFSMSFKFFFQLIVQCETMGKWMTHDRGHDRSSQAFDQSNNFKPRALLWIKQKNLMLNHETNITTIENNKAFWKNKMKYNQLK